MHVDELFDPAALTAAIESGHVRVRTHAHLPLRIYNYSEYAVFERAWTDVTRTCRGLVVRDDGTVVARPWPKFFNHHEPSAGELDLAAPVEVTDKADGSLGIVYATPDGPAVATRGAFHSPQAEHATATLRHRYASWPPEPGWTFLVEIVYPANRVVLDYGDLDDLILLGAVEMATGRSAGPIEEPCRAWPGPRIGVHDHATLADALAAAPRANAEGLVVRYLAGPLGGSMVKIKQDDYLALHRLVTGLTSLRLWEQAGAPARCGGTSCSCAPPRSSRPGSTRPSTICDARSTLWPRRSRPRLAASPVGRVLMRRGPSPITPTGTWCSGPSTASPTGPTPGRWSARRPSGHRALGARTSRDSASTREGTRPPARSFPPELRRSCGRRLTSVGNGTGTAPEPFSVEANGAGRPPRHPR